MTVKIVNISAYKPKDEDAYSVCVNVELESVDHVTAVATVAALLMGSAIQPPLPADPKGEPKKKVGRPTKEEVAEREKKALEEVKKAAPAKDEDEDDDEDLPPVKKKAPAKEEPKKKAPAKDEDDEDDDEFELTLDPGKTPDPAAAIDLGVRLCLKAGKTDPGEVAKLVIGALKKGKYPTSKNDNFEATVTKVVKQKVERASK